MECYNSTQQSIIFIVEIVSCLVTCIGIFIALWQTKYPFRKKIKINVEKIRWIKFNEERIKIDDVLYSFSALNCGNIDVKIKFFGLMDSKNRIITNLNNSIIQIQSQKMSSGSIPDSIAIQSSFSIIGSLNSIVKHIEETQCTSKKDCKILKVFLKDNEGKIFSKIINKRKYAELYKAINESKLRENDLILICDDNTKKKILNITVKWYDKVQGIGYGSSKKVNFDIFFKKEQLLKKTDEIFEGDIIKILID